MQDLTGAERFVNTARALGIDTVFGDDNGYHARSALGFAPLPTGPAVEV